MSNSSLETRSMETNESSKFTHSCLPRSNYDFSREQCQRKVARPAKFIHSCVHFLAVATSDTANLVVRTSGEKTCCKKKKKRKKEHCIPFHWCKQGSLFHRKKAGEKVVLPRDVTDKNRVEPRVHAREAKEQEDTVEKKKDQEHFHRPARKRERVVKKGSKKRANLAM